MLKNQKTLVLLVIIALTGLAVASSLGASTDCCVGHVGDVNNSGDDRPTIGDIARLVDRLFISTSPVDCLTEADINQSGGYWPESDDLTVGDVARLVDHLFITQAPLAECLIPTGPQGAIVTFGTCKSDDKAVTADPVASYLSCVEYTYTADSGVLRLSHLNAGFNCCPETNFDIYVEGDTITIVETETAGLCDCLCLYDLEFVIVDLPPGEYRLNLVEPYAAPGEPRLDFTIDLETNPTGSYCVSRTTYPWHGAPEDIVAGFSSCQVTPWEAASMSAAADSSCLEYSYSMTGQLTINRFRAGFNCCVDYFTVDVNIESGHIIITEGENLDMGGCHCLCLYNLEYAINDLPPGTYDLTIVEPYRDPNDEPLEFRLDLIAPVSGSLCATRSQYPWGY